MLGKIVGLERNTVFLKLNIDLEKFQSLVNLHVVMEQGDDKIIGEIADIVDGVAKINLLGEIFNNEFVYGVIHKPSFGASVRLISKEKVGMIISSSNYHEMHDIKIGKSSVYKDVEVNANINQLFANHFAIFGSTGSGKSCSVARIFQNLFEKKQHKARNANIVIFDAYGEYHTAFEHFNKENPEINFKAYTTNTKFGNSEIMKIPLWLLSVDDICLLLGAERHTQIPIVEKALKLVTVFSKRDEKSQKQKEDIISRAILDILSSGRPPAQIRDQIYSVLSTYNTKDLSLESIIFQPGYSRPIKQLLQLDASGKIREMEAVSEFFTKFLQEEVNLVLPDGSFKYTLSDLKDAFDFALISEGVLKSDKVYDDANMLKVRLHSLVNGDYNVYFDMPEFVTKEQYLKDLFTALNGQKAQIINFNINYIDDRFAKTIVKIYSKLIFDYAKDSDSRGESPYHLVLEEAHRYVQNDNDIHLLGYNIFDRITKEGRKYGVILGLISQRPSELSETSLSQCNNFLIFKMLHPKDIEHIRHMVPNITEEIMSMIRILQPGTCVGFGLAFKVPVLIKFDMPNPEPSSSSSNVIKGWFQ